MKCNEFTTAAESLTPSKLLRLQTEDPSLAEHARECAACGEWLASQRFLGAALQSLRSETGEREAGPHVESAVLQAFRECEFEPAAGESPDLAAPAAWRLSRYFEIGAYVAVAAALIVGVFLGSRVLRDRHVNAAPIQAQTTTVPQNVAPEVQPVTESPKVEVAKVTGAPVQVTNAVVKRSQTVSAQTAKTEGNDGYVALMLCDPLICSGDEQVIRMELPVTGSSPVLADVVVGEDGLVRAMRIVN